MADDQPTEDMMTLSNLKGKWSLLSRHFPLDSNVKGTEHPTDQQLQEILSLEGVKTDKRFEFAYVPGFFHIPTTEAAQSGLSQASFWNSNRVSPIIAQSA